MKQSKNKKYVILYKIVIRLIKFNLLKGEPNKPIWENPSHTTTRSIAPKLFKIFIIKINIIKIY